MLTQPLRWLSKHIFIARLVPALFAPAGLILCVQIVRTGVMSKTTPDQIVETALLLFCAELAWMAYVDLNNVATISAHAIAPPVKTQIAAEPTDTGETAIDYLPTNRIATDQIATDQIANSIKTQTTTCNLLSRFFWTAVSTIVLEIAGFYTALFSPVWGALIVIISQVWFNLLSPIQLFPHQTPAVVPFGMAQRLDVFAANGVAVLLLLLWPISDLRMLSSIGLLILIGLFLAVKYAPSIYASIFTP